jgi:L-asparaginase/Glu-tRNA(Gln) amidotransferase subunit D
MADQFNMTMDHVSAPARRSAAIVPSDVQPLAEVPKALFVGTGGTIAMRGVGDTADQVWKNVADGTVLPFRPLFVRAAGTTAADMLALY